LLVIARLFETVADQIDARQPARQRRELCDFTILHIVARLERQIKCRAEIRQSGMSSLLIELWPAFVFAAMMLVRDDSPSGLHRNSGFTDPTVVAAGAPKPDHVWRPILDQPAGLFAMRSGEAGVFGSAGRWHSRALYRRG
jgi:hypothetical protein